MSKRLVYDVAMSRHPFLVADRTARDVLCWLADAAQERNECRIIRPVGELAEAMMLPGQAVKSAIRRLKDRGFLEKVGRGDFDKRIEVLMINEPELTILPTVATERNDSGIAKSARVDRGSIGAQSGPNRGLIGAQSGLDRGSLAHARFEHEQGTKNKEQGSSASAHATPTDPAAAAWAMWETFITTNGGRVVETERAIITDTVERYGLERTQSAIASLVNAQKRPPAGWVRDRASKAQGQEQAQRPQATPTHRRAGLPTAADRAAAQVDEAAEIARLEAEAAAQRARIEAVAPRPTDAPSRVAVVEPIASPEKMRELGEAVRGLFGSKR